jgi:hypothetical protein
MIKRALQDAGISMPDESREVVFPHGVPVRMLAERHPVSQDGAPHDTPPTSDPISTAAEGDLGTETARLQDQARRARTPEAGQNLLADSA